MEWFINAAEPYSGMEINVLSEGIPTHGYESEVLTEAFEEITGIKVNHQILGKAKWFRLCKRKCKRSGTFMMGT
jgi:glycerol transport system substrate-binding protein